MKKIMLYMLGVLMLCSSAVLAQQDHTHFDGKNYIEGEMLVQLKANYGMRGIISKLPLHWQAKQDWEVSKPMRIWLVKFDHTQVTHAEFQNFLYQVEGVSIVDYNYKVKHRATVPNDNNFNQQWHHVNTGQTGGTTDADIDSDLAWDITTGGTTATNDDIVVCMVESGNLDHNDLSPNRWINTAEIPGNNYDDDGNGYIDDYNGWNVSQNNDNYGTGGHGTNCLGMIGAKGNNGNQVVGANWDVKLMVVADQNGSSQASVIAAYTYPLVMRQMWNNSNGSQGAFVVATSSSWGIDGANPNNYPLWCAFYDTLGIHGIISVGATTNQNLNVDVSGDVPTACPSNYMIGVGRTDHNDNTAGGYGLTTINFGAPGIDVVTTANTNSTTTTTGTSFSCPLTAGVVGLAYSIPCPSFMALVKSNPQQGADLVVQALMDGTDPKSQLSSRFITGGRLNAKNTLDELMLVACSGNICISPSGASAGNITSTGATITWTPYATATASLLYYREVGAPSWTTLSSGGSSLNISALTACTSYEFYMQSVCGSDTSSNTSTQQFTTIGCGNCVDLTYCTNNATDGAEEWIDNISVGTYTNNSGNDAGYGNFTLAGSISMDIGTPYTFNGTPAWLGTQYDEYWKVWIDLDQNGVFDAADLVYDQGTSSQLPVSGTITIPVGSASGSTRMRVQMAYDDGNNNLPTECGSFTYGEVEDYCITVVQTQICGMNVTSTVTDPACSGVDNGTIALNVTGGTPGYTFNWNGAGSTGSTASNLGAGNYTVTVTDATGCDTTISYSLNYTTSVSVSVTGQDVSCNGDNDGSATATASGSTGWAYQWQGGPSTATYNNLTAGTYTVTATDGQGCAATGNVTINEPPAEQASFTSVETGLTVDFTNTSSAGSYSWDFDDGNSSTQTSPTHTYATAGTYNVCLTLTTSCTTDTECENITVEDGIGIEEWESSLIQVFPNPASNVVYFQIDIPSARTIELITMDGKVVRSINVQGSVVEMDLKNLSNGMYFYQVRHTSGQLMKASKLVISK